MNSFLKDISQTLSENNVNIHRIDTIDPESFTALEITTSISNKANWDQLKEKLIAIISATKPTEKFVEDCNQKRIQFIAYNRSWNIPTISSVACDHRNGGELVAEYFTKKNHRLGKSYL